MKTKIKQFFEKISLLFAIIFLSSLVYQTTYGAAVVDESSAIKYVDYKIEWCSPHHANLLNGTKGFNASTSCIEKKLSGSNSILDYDGTNLVGLTDKSSINTTKGLKGAVVDFFKRSGLSLEAEGILKIKIKLLDNADNATSYELTYKIDKTAPQFLMQWEDAIERNANTTGKIYYSGKRLAGIDASVSRNDAMVYKNGNGEAYDAPSSINNYTPNVSKKDNFKRTGLHTLYYKDDTSFDLRLEYNDIFDHDRMKINYVSNVKNHVEIFREGNDTPLGTGTLKDGGVLTLNTNIFKDSNGIKFNSNNKGIFKLRIYDNTSSDPDIIGSKPNYSETAFYAVRDNTAPNVGPDSITFGTVSAFPSGSTLPNISSKYFYADADFEIGYDFKDTGISACETNHALCNVGLAKIDFAIDKAVVTGGGGGGGGGGVGANRANYPLDTSGKHTATGNIVHNFSKVDNTGSRTYSTNIKSRSGLNQDNKICDLVGNCTSINPTFRVIAGKIDKAKSSLTIGPDTSPGEVTKDGIMNANGYDSYVITYDLRDSYDNKIKQDKASPVIRELDIEASINDLYLNQTTLSGTLGTNINNYWNNHFNDKITTIASYVPTVEGYPYLDNDSKIYLDNIIIKDIVKLAVADNYNLENYTISDINGSAGNNISIAGLSESTTSTGEIITASEYGKPTVITSKFFLDNINGTNFPFASPIAFEMTGFTGSLADSMAIDMSKKIKELVAGATNVKVYEKQLVCINGEFGDDPSDDKCKDQQYYKNASDYNELIKFKVKQLTSTGVISFGSYKGSGAPISNFFAVSKGNNKVDVFNYNYTNPVSLTPIVGYYGGDSGNLKSGYVSAISYIISGKPITLPATSRAVVSDGGLSGDYKGSINYFKDQYSLAGGVELTEDIAITGMANKYLNPTNDDKASQARTDIGGNLLRYDLMTTFKSNAKKLSGGIEWCNTTQITNFANLNALSNCKATKSGEDIYFIDNNLKIECSGHCVIPPNKNISIVVRNGNITINSNISSAGNNGRLLLGAYNEMPLVSFSISDIASNSNSGGWIFVKENVTNIDALVLSHGPIMPAGDYHIDDYDDLQNQLHIYGGLLSLNTIRGSFEDPAKCPHIINESTCDIEEARLFDLVFLRRYKEGSGGTPSGGSSGTCGTNNSYNASTGLRCITNDDFKKYPMFIERNTTWDNKPSELMR